MPEPTDQELEALARRQLDDSVSNLDAATLSRLNQARQAAMAQQHKPAWLRPPAIAAAAATLAVVALLPVLQAPEPQTASEPAALLSAQDEALIEDLDLVLFLVDLDDHAS